MRERVRSSRTAERTQTAIRETQRPRVLQSNRVDGGTLAAFTGLGILVTGMIVTIWVKSVLDSPDETSMPPYYQSTQLAELRYSSDPEDLTPVSAPPTLRNQIRVVIKENLDQLGQIDPLGFLDNESKDPYNHNYFGK